MRLFASAGLAALACSCSSGSSDTGMGGAGPTSASAPASVGPGDPTSSTTASGIASSTGTGVPQVPCVATASWTNALMGPLVRRIAISRATGDMYLASYGDGVYHSSDSGATWSNPNAGLGSNLQFHGIGVHEATGTVVACTYDGDNSHGGFEVYRSTDKAATWQKSMSGITFDGTLCVNIAIDEAKNRIVAGVGWVKTVYVSSDDGQSWVEKDAGWPPSPGTISLGLTIDSKGRIWSGSENYFLWRSSDGGDTWEQLQNGLPAPINNTHQVELDSKGTVFVSRTSGAVNGVSKSIDDGATFTPSGLENESLDALLVAPNDVIYAAGGNTSQGMYVSVDAGATWTPMASGLDNHSILGFAVGLDGTIWAGGDGGLYKSAPVCHP